MDNLPPLKDIISKYEIRAKKSLGQNFLLDLNLTSKIARYAGNLKQSDVLEIGPGPGGLTRSLLNEGARQVVSIEKDNRCIAALEEIQSLFPGRLRLLQGDALSMNVTQYLTDPIKIIANLPYNIGTELLVRWLNSKNWPSFWQSMTLMFQKEVANRIVARPGSKAYGRLSVMSQWRCNTKIAFNIPGENPLGGLITIRLKGKNLQDWIEAATWHKGRDSIPRSINDELAMDKSGEATTWI